MHVARHVFVCAYALGRGPAGDESYLPERVASAVTANLKSQVRMRKAKKWQGVPVVALWDQRLGSGQGGVRNAEQEPPDSLSVRKFSLGSN
jgi:hypothetical protein